MPLDEQLERECARAVEAEIDMREHVRRLEELLPQATKQTVAIRHSMIVMLSFVNAIRNGLGAKRMVGEASQGVPQKSVEDTPLFAALPMSARCGSETRKEALATALKMPLPGIVADGQSRSPMDILGVWDGASIQPLPITQEERLRMIATLKRTGDRSLDSEEEAA